MSEGRRKAAPVRRRGKRHWALRVLGWMAALFFLGVIAVSAVFFIGYQTTDIPDPNKAFATNTTTVYFSDGRTPIGSFYDQNRRSVPLSQIPKTVQDAVIAAEDRTFWTNPGISPSGMARAAFNIARGQQLQGGSTITQQYVKIMYLTQERTFSRKFSELFIATKLSREKDKKEILEGYLNTIYFGEGAYGVAAAGDAYFSQSNPAKLSIGEAALLATVLNNPTRFDTDSTEPAVKQRVLDRYRYVLDGMRQTGTITEADYAKWSKAVPPLDKKPKANRFKGVQGFLLDMARKELSRLGVPDDQISGGGLKITTTFDVDLQKKMNASIAERPKKKGDLHIGMASVRPGTGELVAVYGGPDYLKNQLNWATLRARPGSSFKPFAVSAALQNDFNIYSTFQGDSPIEVQGHKLKNEFNKDFGDVTLKEATEQSINTAFYDLVDNQMENGPAELVKAAEAAGIPKTNALERGKDNPSTVLGPDPYASPVEMANAYATFAARGLYVPVHTIKKVDYPGKAQDWTDAKLPRKQTVPQDVADQVNYVLQNVVDGPNGTGKLAKDLDRPVAGKTGTAGGVGVEHRAANTKCDGCKDGSDTLTSWWTGYTAGYKSPTDSKGLSTSVLYRAGKTGESDLDPYSDDPAFFGGNWPLRTWLAFMDPALGSSDKAEFDQPSDDALKDSPMPTNTLTYPPTNPPTNTPTNPPTNTPTNPPTNTPTNPPTNTPTGKPTKTHTPKLPTIPTGGPPTPNGGTVGQ
ncbi:transglycosylase domain-containing protein [Kribbella qitaiheensis]|uniref:transglycosylase domain-containing protein n=1 Tax=Kribbella qitaiheensis TaxID=1544730 RepID=UPI00162715EE|nr:transglycosylase domain-containing protein [Kribbella qitaiheensis]